MRVMAGFHLGQRWGHGMGHVTRRFTRVKRTKNRPGTAPDRLPFVPLSQRNRLAE